MSENPRGFPRLLPFVIVDVLFLTMAGAISALGHRPLLWWEACLMVACGAVAAWSLTAPILRLEGRQETIAQTARLADVAAELQKIEQLASHIHAATLQWKTFESQSALALDRSNELAQSFAHESHAFAEMLQKTGDSEKNRLRVEVEKLRRAEGEWLQTGIRLLDQVFALHQAAVRSGQRSLIDQIGLFQDTCRDSARRVGLNALTPQAGEPFDPRVHQLIDNAAAPEKALVSEVLATGFTYQGQFVRRALVSLQAPSIEPSQQNDLPLVEETKP
jgi:molecular chaperone GrpE (heat shock protein)